MENISKLAIFIFLVFGISHNQAREAQELMSGDSSYIYTSTEYSLDQVWFLVSQRTFFSFRLRACGDGHIILGNTNSNTTVEMTTIIIGGWDNTQSVIRSVNGEHAVAKQTPGILHCNEFRSFWVSWERGVIRLGRGPVYGHQDLMSAFRKDDLSHPINVLYLSTGFDYSGTWNVDENSAFYMRVKTPDNFNYIYLWKTLEYQNSYYTFEVSACHDVHIALGPFVGQPRHEIVLGGWENKRSVIRGFNNGEWKAEYEAEGILQCGKFLMFWISWFDNVIRVGRGDFYEDGDEFLSWKDPLARPINAMGISTGYGATGSWGFDEDIENKVSFWIKPDTADPTTPSFRHWLTVFRRSFTFFNVDSETAAYVALQRNPGPSYREYAIFIGEDNNQKSGVIDMRTGTRVLEVNSKNILWGERTRPFWISWADGVINFGRGGIIGQRQVFSWKSDSDLTKYLGLIGFATLDPNGALWMVKRDMGDQIYLTSKGEIDDHGGYVTVKQEYYKALQIQSGQEAHIFLSRIDTHVSADAFHIAVGEDGGTMTRIRYGNGNGEVIAEANTPGILSASGYRTFWVGWLDNYVRFGKGWRYGQNEIVSMPNPEARGISSLALASKGGDALWRLNSDAGDYMVVRTSSSQLSSKWIKVYPGTEWFYFFVAGSSVKLALGNYRDVDNAFTLTISKTSVSLTRQGRNLASKDVALLNENEVLPFWVSFVNGNIRFGKWRARDMQLQLEYTDPAGPAVNAVGIASLEGTTAEWYFMDNTGVELTFDTPGGLDFQQLWLSVRHINYAVFSVKSCASANVLLSSVMFSEDSSHNYVIIIGAEQNSKTQLRSGGTGRDTDITAVATPDILSCNEERFFWLSWYSGDLSLGRGTSVNKEVIFSWQDMSPVPIHAMSISSSDSNEAVWRYSMTREPFARVPFVSVQSGLSGGEIAGAVIGFLVLFGLFGAAVYVIFRPPPPLQKYVGTQAPMTSGLGSASQAPTSVGFDNPNVNYDQSLEESSS